MYQTSLILSYLYLMQHDSTLPSPAVDRTSKIRRDNFIPWRPMATYGNHHGRHGPVSLCYGRAGTQKSCALPCLKELCGEKQRTTQRLWSVIACAKYANFGICVWIKALFGTRIRNDPQHKLPRHLILSNLSLGSFTTFKSKHTNTMTNSISNSIQWKYKSWNIMEKTYEKNTI